MNRVGIFWDYENCAPPSGTPGYVVAERLRSACGAHGSVTQFRAYLELSVPGPTADLNDLSCPSTSLKNLTLRSELQSSGVSLIDCPHNSRKNVADSMLACDLVCFALDNPGASHANYIPTSPFSIPNTPFSAVTPITPLSRTTIVLVSGDRDFAYPLAVLKARKYDVGLIVPPGGAHPALRAQASWVLNWKDVVEGATSSDPKFEQARAENVNIEAPAPSSARRSSLTSRRGSISGSRRGSVSSTSNPVPPPPSMAESMPKLPPPVPDFLDTAPSSRRLSPIIPLPVEASTSQPSSKNSRKASARRATKVGSRPPSRNKLRAAPRPAKADRAEPESKATIVEQARLQPIIVPVPLTVSPVGSAGPSFAGMSPRVGRPQTPPLFSTNPTSPPPPAAPPALPASSTPPIKTPTPPLKPSTPPADAIPSLHRPPIPHVSTPRPPMAGSQPTSSNEVHEGQSQHVGPPALAAPAPVVARNSVLQSLLPAAPALRPPTKSANPHRPGLTVPALNLQSPTTNALTPATPVTPPASPPFRSWARLQPVNDDTDDVDRPSSAIKRSKKGKERLKESAEKDTESQTEDLRAQNASKTRRGSVKLEVQVGLLLKTGEEPSAISGVDSILRSYSERTPAVERTSPTGGVAQDMLDQKREDGPIGHVDQGEDDDEEEKFHETFFATFSRGQPSVQTPPTVKLMSLEFTQTDHRETAPDSDSQQRSRHSTPRPVPRASHSLPILPMMQSLLAGTGAGKNTESHTGSHEDNGDVAGVIERVYSRGKSPPTFLSHPRRTTSLTTSIDLSKAGLCISPTLESTYHEFRALINVLEYWRRNGADQPLRSLIGIEFSHDVYAQAGATSFKDYVQRAVAAGVVTVGGGSVQGKEWISLNRHWQGLGLVID